MSDGIGRGAVVVYGAAMIAAAAVVGWSWGSARFAVALLPLAAAAHAAAASRGGSGTAAALRVGAGVSAALWFLSGPVFSDDVFRYVLDGSATRIGLNPYAYAPSSPKVADLVAALPQAVNHAALPTIYPPVAQWLFAAFTGAGTLGWRLALVASVAVAGLVGDRTGRRVGGVGVGTFVATHPLLVVTAASSGNVDAVGPLLVFGAVALHTRSADPQGRRSTDAAAGSVIGAAAGVKLFPLLLPIAWGPRLGPRRAGRVFATATGLLLLSYVPFAAIGAKALGSLGRYATSWEYNASLFSLVRGVVTAPVAWLSAGESLRVPLSGALSRALGSPRYFDGVEAWGVWLSPAQVGGVVARAVGAALLGVAVGLEYRRAEGPSSPAPAQLGRSGVHVLGALLLASPVVHPWYLCWLLPLAALAGHRAALVWCGTATLAFFASASAADGAGWVDPVWLRTLEYAPVFALLAADAARARAHSARPHTRARTHTSSR
ncbi:MAG: DUF2029 domain-containing protein [Myxococcales bacterium]|nr:DUF2029 domain-containing protein [Myxococcales bacterium]